MAIGWRGFFGGKSRAKIPGDKPAANGTANPATDGPAIRRACAAALALHKAGNLAGASAGYDAILADAPTDAETLRLRGMLAIQVGQPAAALDFLSRSATADPADARTQANLGMALQLLGRMEEALAAHERAIGLDPAHPAGHFDRGVVLQALARWDDALASYDAALARDPTYAAAHQNRAVVLYHLGRFDDALTAVDQAIAGREDFVEAHCHRGTVLQALHRREAAIESFDRAIALRPALADAHANRGAVLQELRRPEEALRGLNEAIALRPDFPEAHANRANTLLDLARPAEALADCERAISLRPDFAKAHFNRGNVLLDLGRPADAMESYRRARALDPTDCDSLLALLRGKAEHGDWTDRETDLASVPGLGIAGDPIAPLPLLAFEDAPARHRRRAERFAARQFGPPTPALPPQEPRDRLRLGYFSADFRDHVIARLVAGLLERHDRNRFVVHAYAYGPPADDAPRRRIMAGADVFRDVGALSDQAAAEQARRDGIDIAIDLTGYTKHGRSAIFHRRAAPVQVSYLGYPGTMGAPFIDYLIADKVLIPAEQRAHYSESVAYLPRHYLVNDYTRVESRRTPIRAEAGLPETGFVFCCQNNTYKISPAEFDIWMGLLRTVAGSVLWLLRPDGFGEDNLRREAAARGVDPARLVFAPRADYADYLARYRLADLFLDTFHYNANATACDALWAGLPVLTLPGAGLIARAGASLLHAVGLPDLIAPDRHAYAALAVALAQDPARLRGIRDRLAANRATHPLFDTRATTMHIERAYSGMADRAARGLAPADIVVDP